MFPLQEREKEREGSLFLLLDMQRENGRNNWRTKQEFSQSEFRVSTHLTHLTFCQRFEVTVASTCRVTILLAIVNPTLSGRADLELIDNPRIDSAIAYDVL